MQSRYKGLYNGFLTNIDTIGRRPYKTGKHPIKNFFVHLGDAITLLIIFLVMFIVLVMFAGN